MWKYCYNDGEWIMIAVERRRPVHRAIAALPFER